MLSFRTVLAVTPMVTLIVVCTKATAADYIMPSGFTFQTPAAASAGSKWQTASKTTLDYLNLSPTATALQKRAAYSAAVTAYRAYESEAGAAKTEIAAAYAALKRLGLTAEFDRAVYANPAAFMTNSGELAVIRGAGGPSAVMANASRHIDQDLATFRTQLGLSATAWRFNFSPIPRAEALSLCSAGAWAMKTAWCWGDKACYNYWTQANYNCNGVK